MKVLLCSPYGGPVGGISRWTKHIRDYYQSIQGSTIIELSIFSLSRRKGVYANSNIFIRLLYAIIDYFKILKRFRENIENDRFDVIHIVSSASLGLVRDILMLQFVKKLDVKTIVHFRFGRIPELFEKNNLEKKLLEMVIKSASGVIVIDERSLLALRRAGYTNVDYVPNPISPNALIHIDAIKTTSKNDCSIVYAGHIVRSKGIFELITVAKRLSKPSLILIGHIDSATHRQIQEIVGQKCSWLHILGELPYEETLKYMSEAGVFVLPSYTEGFPNVILESMACSSPIVATDVGAIPEMLNIGSKDECGICIPPRDIDKLEEAIRKMLANKKFAERCGQNGRRRVIECYNISNVWRQLEKIWIN